MNIYAKTGDRVSYTGEGGYNRDREKAEIAGLHFGMINTVESVEVQDFVSYVRLVGVPGKHNTVMFADLPGSACVDYAISKDVEADMGQCLDLTPSCYGQAVALPNPNPPVVTRKEYFVTARLHTVVEADDAYEAMLNVKDALDTLIANGYAANDPAHSAMVTSVYEIPEVQ